MSIDYTERIPNNVNLAEDRRLQRALESWQPAFLHWWGEMGPTLPTHDVYLRTAVAVGREGWANFDRVKVPEYRWGIFLAERDPDRQIAFGQHKGEPVWQQVPGEHRSSLQRLIVVQGDTEPASVEQQRRLGQTAPSLYDLRNLFQVNVEEGRHLWAMVYLLHAYFGRAGRDEAEALLLRNSGSEDSPRILGAFNEETPDWLSFFMFTYFTDRDGKYQLGTLKESAFDPLSRTCEFMLKEEAHHMFVGTTGVDRVVERTAVLMREHDTDDVAPLGGIPLAVIQKYLNFHYSVSLDLFGGETSTNVANYFTSRAEGALAGGAPQGRPRAHRGGDRGRADRRRPHRGGGTARAHRAQPRPAHRSTSPTARPGSPGGTASWPRAGSPGPGCACRTWGSTARSGCSPAATSPPTARSWTRRPGRRAARPGCPPRPTRPTWSR